MSESLLKIIAQGAWNGGTIVDNAFFEGQGMTFKNDIPVTGKTIEERIGVRTRVAAPRDARIGKIALKDLMETSEVDPARVKLLIGATNVGEDKFDPGPLIRNPLSLINGQSPDVDAFDLYAGCPGFNVSVELVFMLSASGLLKTGDISVIVGAENIHRANAFVPGDTANIIFGDDAVATALETTGTRFPEGDYTNSEKKRVKLDAADIIGGVADAVFRLTGGRRIDGLIIDNQLGKVQYRIPATAVRVQHRLVELTFPEASNSGIFNRFKTALNFYDTHVRAFAFDIMSMAKNSEFVDNIAGAYVRSGKYDTVVSAYLDADLTLSLTLHHGQGFMFRPPHTGVIDTATSTHGCFSKYIQVIEMDGESFGEMDGKGVFLYATRGAVKHIAGLLEPHGLTLNDLDLVIEHQANFAMIPLTFGQLLGGGSTDVKKEVKAFVADKMLTNIHTRGNCSVISTAATSSDRSFG